MTITNVRPFPVAQAEARRLRRQASLRTLLWSLGLGVLALVASYIVALAAAAPNCSGTATGTAGGISFPSTPQVYVTIVNASATAKLWLNVSNGTAAANTAGSFPLESEGSSVTLPAFPTISIISTAGSAPYTCFYQ